jgi:hypothetical protein
VFEGRNSALAERMRQRAGWLVLGTTALLLGAPSSAQTPTDGSEVEPHEIPLHGETEESLREVARQINNPISPLWQITFDNAITGMDGGGLDSDDPAYTGTFQPFMPVNLSFFGLDRFAWAREFRVATQLSVPFVETVPLPTGPGDGRKTGFGDIQLAIVLAPSRTSGLLWGIGPTFIFPSASNDALGQEKWQAGPAVLAGYLGSKWTAYTVAQQWWSFAGDGDRATTNQLCLEYVLLRSLPHRWQVGMQPSLTVDWTASKGNKLSFPIGLGFGKTVRVGKLPIQIWVEADYYPVRPDDGAAPRWGIDIQIIPVIGSAL